MDFAARLSTLIKNKKAKVGIVGIGYVGSALASATSEAGFFTLGFDISAERIAVVNSQKKKKLRATGNFKELKNSDIICICVPTPIDEFKRPNLSSLKDALANVSKNLRSSQLVIIESSIAPGTTRNVALPILQQSGYYPGTDFFLAHAPERIDPGNTIFGIKNTPKVIGALNPISQKLTVEFYRQFVQKIIPVTSLEVAEMTKVLENTFRFVNISLVNEISQFAKVMNIDIWEVIAAAQTKPFGFLAHYPGPGIGGDCIPVLPYHLLDVAKTKNVDLQVVKAATAVNEIQPAKIAQKAIEVVNGKLSNNGQVPKALLVGISYKPETADIRQSPALKIWQMLEKSGISVSYYDPYVQKVNGSSSQNIVPDVLARQDVIIITTDHKNIPYDILVRSQKPLIDTRNVLAGYRQPHIIRL